MQMNRREMDILREFRLLKKKTNDKIPKEMLDGFVKQNFQAERLDRWTPPDFKDYPLILTDVQDIAYR